jgi:ArsR family transcriptional regulator, arsenate/arsenite/antimonite-responsive transcriptional repressor
MHEPTLIELEKLFLALSDRTRMQLLALMANGEVSVGYLADSLNLSQPKISRHLAYMRNMGLVSTRRDGKWIYYQIDPEMPVYITRVLAETLEAVQSGDADRRGPRSQREEKVRSIRFEEESIVEEKFDHREPADDWAPNEMEVFLL